MTRKSGGKRHVKTVETSFDIIESLRELDHATLGELASELGVAKSTIHRHIVTLHDRGYVVRDGEKYHLSLRFLDVGHWTQTRERTYVLAESKVAELAERTNERVQFIVEENGYAVYVHMESGEHAVKTDTHVGKHTPIHTSAGGLAILSSMDKEEVEEIIDVRGLEPATPYTITDREELFEELESIRNRGYSVNDQGHIEGLRAIGVPVHGPDDEVVGALSVSGPTNRMQGEWFKEELPNLLLGSANELELNAAYQ